jgi:hypothetical protein
MYILWRTNDEDEDVEVQEEDNKAKGKKFKTQYGMESMSENDLSFLDLVWAFWMKFLAGFTTFRLLATGVRLFFETPEK